MATNYLESFGVGVGNGKYHEEAIYGMVLLYGILYDRMSTYLDKYDLTPAKMNVLMIAKHQGKEKGLSQMDFGHRLMVTASNMTRVLDKLEKQGFIQRTNLVEDKRTKMVTITAKGSSLLDQVWPGYIKKLEELGSHMTKDEQKMMSELVQKWMNQLVS